MVALLFDDVVEVIRFFVDVEMFLHVLGAYGLDEFLEFVFFEGDERFFH